MISACATGRHWSNITIKPHHGVVVPLFALHTKESCGIGEYPDLIQVAKWCKEVGFDIIQLLPLNDTGPDSGPYCSISAIALNPIYIGLTSLPYLKGNNYLIGQLPKLQHLTKSKRIDYAKVYTAKDNFLRQYYNAYKDQFINSAPYSDFKNANPWLKEYALFKSIKESRQWEPWNVWPTINSTDKTLVEEADYQIFLQYLCYVQLRDVHSQASQMKILLMGDIPILINKESADVWAYKENFDLSLVAGAPPDMYAKDGQKWGFPLYNWDHMALDGFAWWKNRLEYASNFYDIYRIDHIVGFYRIWAIPEKELPKNGFFLPENKANWIPQGDILLRMMIESCTMLPIGEDLGVIPPEVRVHMKELGICGTKVMRWERRWDEDGGFVHPQAYIPESLTTVSTHDSETLEQWWENNPEEVQLYADTMDWEYSPRLINKYRKAILRSSHHSGSLFHINLLQEYLGLIPNFKWPEAADERINIPGTISDFNWTYRFRPSFEEIANNKELKQEIAEILRPSYNVMHEI